METTESRRRTTSLQGGDTGLAEWTSKIKAMQRQVDADEETEQRRLEDEIRASRLARTRRSTGYQSDFGKRTFTPPVDETPENEFVDRGQSHADALRKLTGEPSSAVSSNNSSSRTQPISLAQFMGGNATGPRLNRPAPQQDTHDPTQFEQRSYTDIKSPHPVFGRGGVAMPGLTTRRTEPASIGASRPGSTPELGPNAPRAVSPAPPTSITKQVKPSSEPTLAPTHTRPSRTRSPDPSSATLTTTTSGSSYSRPTSYHQLSAPQVESRVSARSRTPSPSRGVSLPSGGRTPARDRSRSPLPRPISYLPPEPPKPKVSPLPVSPPPVAAVPVSRPEPILPAQPIAPPVAPKPAFNKPNVSKPSEPVSLAQFMGGRATGPRLNKPAPQQDAHDPTQFEQRAASNITSPHPVFGRGGVAMPGLASRSLSSESAPRSITPTNVPALTTPPITTPSLARPIQPAPRTPAGPQISATASVSPAFLHAPAPKDLTPSLSRLQGRGFVKNMVHKSSELVTTTTGGGRPNEMGRVASGKKPSVLDRWPPSTSSAEPSSPTLRTPPPNRKSLTVDSAAETPATPPSPAEVKPVDGRRSLKSVASLPSMSAKEVVQSASSIPTARQMSPDLESPPLSRVISPQKVEGIGSSSTMISYIKPMKTGDDPAASPGAAGMVKALSTSNDMGDFGVRSWGRNSANGVRGDGRSSSSEVSPVSSSRPLSHPTKDRARKPKKAPSASSAVDASRVEERRVVEQLPRVSQQPPPTIAAVQTQNLAASALEPPVRERPRSVSPPSPRLTTPPTSSAQKLGLGHPSSLPSESPLISPPSSYGESAGVRGGPPPSPSRHKRIPSTGTRATVMDVAQAMQEEHMRRASEDEQLMITPSPTPPPPEPQELEPAEPDFELLEYIPPSSPTRSPIRRILSPISNAEKRRSNYEKYASIILPPLAEENTPTPSPSNTLSKTDVAQLQLNNAPAPQYLSSRLSTLSPTAIEEEETQEVNGNLAPPVIRTAFQDEPLPRVDAKSLLQKHDSTYLADPDVQTIQVEVLLIEATSANAVSGDLHVFYDTDVLAIVHRAKTKSTGLVSTQVWGWHGKQSKAGEREERKLAELGKRYGTNTTKVHQYAEPAELVHAIGGKLAIRQGSRAHWSKENTAMHLIRSVQGSIFIDELDLNVRNLCSGFSYCLSILETVYVWHGVGSTDAERDAAREYGQSLSQEDSFAFIELMEGVSDDDEMFWMILGDEEYAKASYWKWRPSGEAHQPRVWRVQANDGKQPMRPITSWVRELAMQDHIYVIDCVYEFFILVGSEVRGNRLDIRLALSVASEMSTLTAEERPFSPTLHVLVAPTQLPADLRLAFRDLDEERVNLSVVPDHMNLLEAQEAYENLSKTVWSISEVGDESMLPLGMQSSPLPSPA